MDNGAPAVAVCHGDPMNSALPPAELGLSPAARLLWRSPHSVHLELGSRAVVVDGLPPRLVRRIAAPTPPRGSDDVGPAPDPATGRVLAALAEAGYLWPRSPGANDRRLAAPDPRLAGELGALAVQHGEQAVDVLLARRRAAVAIHGPSRVAAHVGAVLAAAGVGRVHCGADGPARLAHAVPGGVTAADEGGVLAAAAEAALRRAAPEVDTTPLPLGERADLTILAVDGPVSDGRIRALHAAGAAYLSVTLGIDCGIVGPLVLPGLTGCLLCIDRHRRDRDPAWAALAVQLTVGRRHGPAAPVALATVIAGVAAQQALTFLDRGQPDCLDGTIELRLPDWRLRRRSWPPHPECGCADASDTPN